MENSLESDLAQAADNLAAQRYADARAICDRLLAGYSDDPEVLHLAGLVRFRQGEAQAAIDLLSQSLDLRPDSADVLVNLGAMQEELKNDEAACGCFAAALDLLPADTMLRYRLGRTLFRIGDFGTAEMAYRGVLDANSNFAEAHYDLGLVLRAQGRMNEAVAAFERSAEIAPDNPAAWHELSQLYGDAGVPEKANAASARAVALTGDPILHANWIGTQSLDPRATAEQIATQRRLWAERFADPLTRAALPHDNERRPDRRLRVGYVLADTCRYHTHAMILLPLIEAHDREALDVYCYSDTPPERADAITERFRRACTLRETHHLDDEALAALIRRDRIDVAFDVFGHSAGSRLRALARNPAPLQVCFPYQGSNWMAAIPHVIGDRIVIPTGMRANFKEQVVDLTLAHVYQPLCTVPAVTGESPFERSGRITFGNFGRLSRLNDAVLTAWAKILARVPNARLLLKLGADQAHYLPWFKARLQSCGVSDGRVSYAGWAPNPTAHLASHNELDILLDTFPYGGTTTSCEALLMGVPIVTLASDRAFGRYAADFLTMLDMPALITATAEEYMNAAVALANDHGRRGALRQDLAIRFRQSPLCDSQRMARELEHAYRRIWRDWCGR